MYASATSRWRSSEKISVTLTGMPLAIVSSIAGRPSLVAGILISTFGRSIRPCRRAASSIVAWVSCARFGSTSSETQPSLPLPSSQTLRSSSQAARMSSRASSRKISFGSDSVALTSLIWSSYASPSAIAPWKIVGLEVTPTTPSATRPARSPSLTKLRDR